MQPLPMGTKAYTDPLDISGIVDARAVDQATEAFQKSAAAMFNLNGAFYRMSQTADGIAVMDFLRKNTIEAGTWLASLASEKGLDAANAHGYAREGQNALVRDMLVRIEIAASAKSPEDYINMMQMKGQ